MNRIAIIGAGAWGTALALVARRAGRDVVLWAFEPEVVEAVNGSHENPDFLPGVPLDPGIAATGDLTAALDGAELVLMATPAGHLRAVSAAAAGHVAPGTPVVSCAKGIEQGTLALMTEVLGETMPGGRRAVLSGPTFAAEVARRLPTAVTLAAEDHDLGERVVHALGSHAFRPYWSDDMVGAQIGGAVKNVVAIACGIVAGREMGANAKAALITRGLAEMVRLGRALGAREETFLGLSGLGDLTLTCNDIQSRNMSLGAALGRGETLASVLGARRAVTEGVHTAVSVVALAQRLGVDMPICRAVHAILHEGAGIDDAVGALLARPFRAEPGR